MTNTWAYLLVKTYMLIIPGKTGITLGFPGRGNAGAKKR